MTVLHRLLALLLSFGAIAATPSHAAGTVGCGPDEMGLAAHLGEASARVVDDAAAPQGRAARQPGANTQWSIQWPVPIGQIERGRVYRIRLLVRADRKGDAGKGIHAGVYRPADKSYPTSSINLPASALSGAGYEWLDIGPFTPRTTDFVFIAPTNNPANVAALYTARIELVPVTADLAEPGANGWANALAPLGEPSPPLTLAEHGRTDYVIVVPAEANPQEDKAAELLAVWLGDTTGARFPIVTDAVAPQPREICVGRTNRPVAAREQTMDLGDEGYTVRVEGERICLIGGRRRGPIYAALALLEEDLGCRWYTQDYGRVERRPTLKVGIVPRSFVPPFALRDPYYRVAFNGAWSLMNRTNAPGAKVPEQWGGQTDYVPGWSVHTFGRMVPADTFFKERPDYFQLTPQGERSTRNPCPTHPDVIRIGTESVLAALEEYTRYELIDVSSNDIRGVCQCPRCKAVNEAEGSASAGPLTLVNAVADAVAEKHPGVLVSTLAYQDTVQPPRTLRPRPNVIIRLCTDSCAWQHPFRPACQSDYFRRALEGWAAIHDKLGIWDYSVDFGNYMKPWPSFSAIAANLRDYRERKVRMVMIQGAYQSPGNERELMRAWVFAKLLWDPGRDCWPLMEDFIRGYFGPAAPPIVEYNRMLYESGLRAEGIEKIDGFLARAKALFYRAEELAAGDAQLIERVHLDRLPIVHWEITQLQGKLHDPEPEGVRDQLLALLDEFTQLARRENLTMVSERLRTTDWEQRLRKMLSPPDSAEMRAAKVGETEVAVYRLSADWKFAKDDADAGVNALWFEPAHEDDKWLNYRTDLGVGWENQGSSGDGYGWFRKVISAPEQMKHRHLYLYFCAVDESAWVYVDGKLVHENTPATTGLEPQLLWTAPFAVELGALVRPGTRHQLTVRVQDCGGMGGIYMPVFLVGSDAPLTAQDITGLLQVKNPWL